MDTGVTLSVFQHWLHCSLWWYHREKGTQQDAICCLRSTCDLSFTAAMTILTQHGVVQCRNTSATKMRQKSSSLSYRRASEGTVCRERDYPYRIFELLHRIVIPVGSFPQCPHGISCNSRPMDRLLSEVSGKDIEDIRH